MDALQPWDMQPEETDNRFQAFQAYRDMGGKRTLRAVAEKFGKSTTIMERWSSLHDWPNRARQYDRYTDQQMTKAWMDERRAQVEQTNALGTLLTERAIQRVADSTGRAIPGDAIRAAEVAAKIQSMGMVDVKPENQSEKDSALMVDAAALVAEMYRRAQEEGTQ